MCVEHIYFCIPLNNLFVVEVWEIKQKPSMKMRKAIKLQDFSVYYIYWSPNSIPSMFCYTKYVYIHIYRATNNRHIYVNSTLYNGNTCENKIKCLIAHQPYIVYVRSQFQNVCKKFWQLRNCSVKSTSFLYR